LNMWGSEKAALHLVDKLARNKNPTNSIDP